MLKIRLQALKDLMSRYKAVFAAAWAVRDQLDGPMRREDELAFMPAHLELAETPVHPAPRWTMRIIAIMAILVILVSLFGRLDIVAVTKGKLLPNGRVKVIQPAITGVVRSIRIKDGQRVKAGQLLMELDATQAAADTGKAHSSRVAAALASARARSLLEAQQAGKLPVFPSTVEAPAVELQAAQAFAEGQYREYQDKRAALQAELAKRQAEQQGTLQEIEQLRATAPLARQQANDYKALVGDKYVSRHEYLEKEKNALQLEYALATQRSHVRELQAQIMEQRAQIATLASQFRREQMDALDKASQQLDQYRDDETKATTREGLLRLTAPVSGTVQQLAVHTLGGVVTTAQALMEVVPDGALEIEATVENKDIGFVRAGQRATVKIESFPYTRYGYLDGTVRSVSNNAVQDRRKGLAFIARIQLASSRMLINGQWVSLTPGMAVTAEIKTGTRSVAAYFLDPLVRAAQESMRER